VDAKDPMTEHHCSRVADRALVLARLAGLEQDAVEAVGYGAVLHDVGKIGIDDFVLRKSGPLSDDERIEMQRHPIVGADILRPLRLGSVVSPIVRAHHERWDGNGYPDRLRGEQIPIGARIVNIIDSHDAMTHDRPYRARLSDAEAYEELTRNRGTQFDPELLDLYLAHLDGPLADGDADPFTQGLRNDPAEKPWA
jgi:putative two-component system response regulator